MIITFLDVYLIWNRAYLTKKKKIWFYRKRWFYIIWCRTSLYASLCLQLRRFTDIWQLYKVVRVDRINLYCWYWQNNIHAVALHPYNISERKNNKTHQEGGGMGYLVFNRKTWMQLESRPSSLNVRIVSSAQRWCIRVLFFNQNCLTSLMCYRMG